MTNNVFRQLATVIFILIMPILIVTTSAKSLVLDSGFYDSDQATNGVLATSGLPASTLRSANRGLVAYFANPDATLDSELKKNGLPSDLFSQREVGHLVDVKNLVWMMIALQQMTLGYVLLFLVGNLLFSPKRFLLHVRAPLLWGGGLTLAILLILGLWSQIDFDGFFLLFHIVSFDNDLWMLNPSKDVLLRMYPQVFWFHAAVIIVVYSALGALATAVAGAVLHMRRVGTM